MDFKKGEILAFDKPYEWTSFGLVAKVRYLLCKRLGVKKLKVGHAGTLDPLATGVLLVCTGKATKRIEELQAHTKEYADAAKSEESQEICLKGAKGLAMTGYDILSSDEFQAEIRRFHEQQIPDFYKEKKS